LAARDGGGRGGGATRGEAAGTERPTVGRRVAAAAAATAAAAAGAAAAASTVRRVVRVEDTSAPADESDVTDEADEAVGDAVPAPPTGPTGADVSAGAGGRGGARRAAGEGPRTRTRMLSGWWVVLSILDGVQMVLVVSLFLSAIVSGIGSQLGGGAATAAAVSLAASIPGPCLPILFPDPDALLGWPAAAASICVLVALVVAKVRSHQAGRVTLLPSFWVVQVMFLWGFVAVTMIRGVSKERLALTQYCERFLPADSFFARV